MILNSLDLKKHIREIPNFPKEGILFRDISPLLKNPEGWAEVIKQFTALGNDLKPDLIVGIESRGFIVGSALATAMGIGFVPIRKKGKLPGEILGIDYELEYGTDRLEIQSNVFKDKVRVLIVDDLLATGGTAKASAQLVKLAGGNIVGFGFIIELSELNGKELLPPEIPILSLISYS